MINKETLDLIKLFEGIRLEAYPDPGSKNGLPWTIGYGHTKGVKKGDKITKVKAEAFLVEDLKDAEAIVKKYVKNELNENQYGSQVSFVHNLGERQYAKSSVLKYINSGRLAEVPGRMALYRFNGGKVMEGLVRRRAAEGALWMKPVSTMETSANEQVAIEVKEAQGKPAEPAVIKKPFDWGVIGIIITTVAGFTDEVKKAVGDITSAFGIPPLYLLGFVVLAFGAYSLWSRFRKER